MPTINRRPVINHKVSKKEFIKFSYKRDRRTSNLAMVSR